MTVRDYILSRLRLAEREEESIPLGGPLCVRELTRAAWRDVIGFTNADDDTDAQRTRFYAAMFAGSVVDRDTKQPLLTPDEVLLLAADDAPRDMWPEIVRIADIAYSLSEVGPESLKSDDPAPDTGRRDRRDRRQRKERSAAASVGTDAAD